MTDEAITECMKNLPPDSDFDGEYYAALAREKADWIIGMNLSRLYGVLDGYPHRIGRVKTPVLAIVAERDNEIEKFEKTVTYRLEMENGAVSQLTLEYCRRSGEGKNNEYRQDRKCSFRKVRGKEDKPSPAPQSDNAPAGGKPCVRTYSQADP